MVQAINVTQNNPMQIHRATWGISAPAVVLPTGERDYCIFNQDKVNFLISQKEHALPQLKETLQNSQDEKEIVEALYVLDKLADNNIKGIPRMYPILATHNDTKSANIQSLLAGIYRKTQVPDAFGPLVKMLIQNSTTSEPTPANEEIGGAILAYIENYSNKPQKIDYSA